MFHPQPLCMKPSRLPEVHLVTTKSKTQCASLRIDTCNPNHSHLASFLGASFPRLYFQKPQNWLTQNKTTQIESSIAWDFAIIHLRGQEHFASPQKPASKKRNLKRGWFTPTARRSNFPTFQPSIFRCEPLLYQCHPGPRNGPGFQSHHDRLIP